MVEANLLRHFSEDQILIILTFSPFENNSVMQIVSILFLLPLSALGFGLSRRDACLSAVVAGVGAATPEIANAFSQQLDDYIVEPSQQATNGKLDLNAAFVGEYTQLRGMYPHAAGKIASSGPYASVKDIYRIPGLTNNDKKLFKLYEKEFTVNPPGRAFKERINARVST